MIAARKSSTLLSAKASASSAPSVVLGVVGAVWVWGERGDLLQVFTPPGKGDMGEEGRLFASWWFVPGSGDWSLKLLLIDLRAWARREAWLQSCSDVAAVPCLQLPAAGAHIADC